MTFFGFQKKYGGIIHMTSVCPFGSEGMTVAEIREIIPEGSDVKLDQKVSVVQTREGGVFPVTKEEGCFIDPFVYRGLLFFLLEK